MPTRNRARQRFSSFLGWIRDLLFPARGRRREPGTFRWKPEKAQGGHSGRLDWWVRLVDREPGEVSFLLDVSAELDWATEREVVLGVGYALAGQRKWRPLIQLDARRLGMPPTAQPRELDEIRFKPEGAVGALVSNVPDALVLPTARPEALAGPGHSGLVGARGSRSCATAGVRTVRRLGEDEWRPGFLTAGHAFPGGVGSDVVSLPGGRVMRMLRELTGREGLPRTGVVAVHRSPALRDRDDERAEYDFALVDLDDAGVDAWHEDEFTSEPASAPDEFPVPQRVVVHGGVSGVVDRATLMGALMAVAHRWRDCWLLGPATALQKGDSGSSVYDYDDGRHLGMLVGRSVLLDASHHLYVQSIERLMAECLAEENVLVESAPTKGIE